MKTAISIVEIPTTDLARATAFYQAVLGIKIEEIAMGDTRMGLFPDGGAASVALISGADYKPSADGTIVFLQALDDLQNVQQSDPKRRDHLSAKTEISREIGFLQRDVH